MNTNLSNLPVAPEFVESLRENVSQTLLDALEKIGASQQICDLVNSLNEIAHYNYAGYACPEILVEKDNAKRYGSEQMVIDAVNAIAKVGGTFAGAGTSSIPREGTLLANEREETKRKVS